MHFVSTLKTVVLAAAAGLLSAGAAQASSTYTFRSYSPGVRSASVPTVPPVTRTYATLDPAVSGSGVSVSGGNLISTTGGSSWSNNSIRGTFGVSSGKWYWEATVTEGSFGAFGVVHSTTPISGFWAGRNDYLYYSTGNKFNDNAGSGSPYGAGFGAADVIGIALDMDVGSLTFYKNGISQGVAYTGITGTYYPIFAQGSSGRVVEQANFGATPLAYPVAGYNSGLYR